MQQLIQVVTTTPSLKEAQDLSKEVLQSCLAACAQIEAIESLYHWEGNINHDQEYRVIFKTRADYYAQLESLILQTHSYQVPQIIALPILNVSESYALWVLKETERGV